MVSVGKLIGIFENDEFILAVYIGKSKKNYEYFGRVLPIFYSKTNNVDNITNEIEKNIKYLKDSVRNKVVNSDLINLVIELPSLHDFVIYDLNLFNMGGELVEDFKPERTSNKTLENSFLHDRFDLIVDRFLEVQNHNFNTFKSLKLGDIITMSEYKFFHHDALISNKEKFKVISKYNPDVVEESIVTTAPFRRIYHETTYENKYPQRSTEQIVEMARKRLGPEQYNVFKNNCQTFTTGCRYIIPEPRENGICRELKEKKLDIVLRMGAVAGTSLFRKCSNPSLHEPNTTKNYEIVPANDFDDLHEK